ncbi:hypothetical protein LB543_01485 [Mesorhizobium sp. ESP7-2]|uniref:hypothetical protein n=1 Tax=Mesorhizobium sp. ESP7-2 TaxID=2876622 RepID=UPI001CCD1BCF|nr:hypothetical protein [Mesorhizobium sp. ESP7-2]MBZ9705401.1 hypothetical protein [Mesorhizobium sp. ESP7-2]
MTQIRLILLGLVVLAFMGLGLVAYHYKLAARDAQAEARQAAADLKTAEGVNDANQATIGRMKAQAEADAMLAATLAEQVAAANQKFIDDATERAKLGHDHEDIGKFLDLDIPDALRGGVPVQPKAKGAGPD